DGMIGKAGEGQVTITGKQARRAVQMMRVEHEAIMVGASTVAADDPLLTVRLPGLVARSPARAIVDPFARTPRQSRLLSDAGSVPVVILASEKADKRRQMALRDLGADIRLVASDYRGRFEPREILRVLGLLGYKSVFLEGGAETARRFIEADVVDRIDLF